jgi:hypothetical protein
MQSDYLRPEAYIDVMSHDIERLKMEFNLRRKFMDVREDGAIICIKATKHDFVESYAQMVKHSFKALRKRFKNPVITEIRVVQIIDNDKNFWGDYAKLKFMINHDGKIEEETTRNANSDR